MAIDFNKLKEKISEVDSAKSNNSQKDENQWYPVRDKAGNGYAVIRFLPGVVTAGEEEMPWVQLWNHWFQGPGGWYVENSLTTLGRPDPVSEANGVLWNSGIDANKEIARARKRQLAYYSNIEIIKDPANPENEGKVFKFRYGKKIYNKIKEAMSPEFEDETAVNPFELGGPEVVGTPPGANFKLKISDVEGYANYDKSIFDNPSQHKISDEKLNTRISLQSIISEDQFKSYDELKAKFDRVVGTKVDMKKTVEDETEKEEDIPYHEPKETPVKKAEFDEDDDQLAGFQALAD